MFNLLFILFIKIYFDGMIENKRIASVIEKLEVLSDSLKTKFDEMLARKAGEKFAIEKQAKEIREQEKKDQQKKEELDNEKQIGKNFNAIFRSLSLVTRRLLKTLIFPLKNKKNFHTVIEYISLFDLIY